LATSRRSDRKPALDQSFGYDAAGRLKTITTAGASWTIAYDANGNRTGVTLNGTTSAYSTEATSNGLSSTTNPARSFSYDPAGNTTSSTAVNPYTAAYNLAGRLASLTKAGVTTTYSVDGNGRRVRKFSSTGAASTVIFVYDQPGQILGEYDSTGKAIREYVWMGTTPVAVFTPDPAAPAGSPIVFTIHTDHLDTPRVVLDKNGAIRWRWMAEPFGTTAPETNPSNTGAFALHLRFPGQYFDQESGLHYNYFRTYDASLGRYIQSDPIGLAGGINTYLYAYAAPTSFVDPNGLLSAADLPTLPNWLVDGAAGFGDSLTLNGTSLLRDLLNANASVNRCSTAYRYGEYADLAFETSSMGLSALLKQLAKNASRSAVRAEFRAATRNVPRNGGQLHHNNPLFGHPGNQGATTVFPTGGLPAAMHSSSLNLTRMPNHAAHIAAHKKLQAQEAAIEALLMNPAITGARAAKDFAQSCECP
jgi:RHS repeat-associated protein